MILPQENSTVGTVIILDKGSIKAFEEHLEIDESNTMTKQNDTSIQIHLTLPPYSKLQKASLEYFRITSEITDPSWSKLALFHVNFCNFKNWQDPNSYSLANQVISLGSVDKTPSHSPQPLPLHSIISSLLTNLTQENGKPLKLLRIVYLRLASKEQIDRELKGLEMVEDTSSPLFVPDLTVLLNHYLTNQYLAQMKLNAPKLEIQAVCVNCCPYKSDVELPPLKKEFLECGFGVSETIFTSYLDIPSKIQQLAMSHWDLYSIDLIKEPNSPNFESTEKRLKIDDELQSKDLTVLSRFNYCRALNAPHINHHIHWSDPNYIKSRHIKMYLGTNPNFDTSLSLTQCIHKLCYRDLDESYGHDILKPLVDFSQPYYLLQDEVSHQDEDIYMHQYMIKKDGDYLTIHCLLQVFQDKQQESPPIKPNSTEADYIGWDIFKRDFIQASMPNSNNILDLMESTENINGADKQPFLVSALIPQNQAIDINSQIASKLPLTTTFMNNYIWWEMNLICEEEDSSEYIRFVQQNRSLHLLKSSILSPKEFNAFEIETTLDLFTKCFLSLSKVSSYDPDHPEKTEPPLLLFTRMPYLLQRLYNSFPHCRQLISHMASALVSLLNNFSDLFHQLGIITPHQAEQIKNNYVSNPSRMKKYFAKNLILNWSPVPTKVPIDAIVLFHLHYHQFQKECPSLLFASGPCPLSIQTQHGSFDGLEWLKILISISPTTN